jgi:hypothetical protein
MHLSPGELAISRRVCRCWEQIEAELATRNWTCKGNGSFGCEPNLFAN